MADPQREDAEQDRNGLAIQDRCKKKDSKGNKRGSDRTQAGFSGERASGGGMRSTCSQNDFFVITAQGHTAGVESRRSLNTSFLCVTA